MSDVTLDQMGQYQEPVNIVDSQGKFLGVFVPAKTEQVHAIARVISQIDWAEIERRRTSPEPRETYPVFKERMMRVEEEMARRKQAGEKEMTPEEGLQYFQTLRQGERETGHGSAS